MSDDIEIPEVDTDNILETSDEETSVAGTVAIVAAGVAAGLGIGYGVMKLSNKIEDVVARRAGDKTPEGILNDHSEE